MPVWILTALAAVGGLGFIFALLAGLVRFAIPLWAVKLEEAELVRIRSAIRGAITLAEPVVKLTPTTIDDAFLDNVVRVALAEFERVRGTKPKLIDSATIKDIAKGIAIEKNKAVSAKSLLGSNIVGVIDLKARP